MLFHYLLGAVLFILISSTLHTPSHYIIILVPMLFHYLLAQPNFNNTSLDSVLPCLPQICALKIPQGITKYKFIGPSGRFNLSNPLSLIVCDVETVI